MNIRKMTITAGFLATSACAVKVQTQDIFDDIGEWFENDFVDFWEVDFVNFMEEDFVNFWEEDFVDFWEEDLPDFFGDVEEYFEADYPTDFNPEEFTSEEEYLIWKSDPSN